MKYLKLYEELIDNSILLDVKDILLEFTDVGNDIRVDWVDSRYKDELVIIIRNKTLFSEVSNNLDVDTFIRLFNYMKDLKFECDYIRCEYPVNPNQFEASDKIYIIQHAKDFNLHMDIDSINSWNALELVFHKMKD